MVFDAQYYSLANVMVHTICLDYRFRPCSLQLYEFIKLTATEKKKLLDKNRNMQIKSVNYLKTISGQLNISPNASALQTIEEIIIKDMKKFYHFLLKEYSNLFAKVITEQHRKMFPHLIVSPNQLGLFGD